MNKWIHSLTRSYNNVSAAATHPLAAMSGNKGHESVSYALVALRFAFLLLGPFSCFWFLTNSQTLRVHDSAHCSSRDSCGTFFNTVFVFYQHFFFGFSFGQLSLLAASVVVASSTTSDMQWADNTHIVVNLVGNTHSCCCCCHACCCCVVVLLFVVAAVIVVAAQLANCKLPLACLHMK